MPIINVFTFKKKTPLSMLCKAFSNPRTPTIRPPTPDTQYRPMIDDMCSKTGLWLPAFLLAMLTVSSAQIVCIENGRNVTANLTLLIKSTN